MHLMYEIFGEGKDLSILQMCDRAIVIFIITLILIRMAGIRAFGKRSSFDNVVTIMLGAVLSRAVVGASDFAPTIAAAAVFVIMHRVIGRITLRPSWFSKLIKGAPYCLFRNGQCITSNMKKVNISKHDMEEAIRKQMHQGSFEKISEIYIERDGTLSILLEKNHLRRNAGNV